MKQTLSLAALVLLVGSPAARGQQPDVDELREELARQQQAISELTEQIEAIEQRQEDLVTQEDLEDEALTQQDAVSSLRENFFNRVAVDGFVNTLFLTSGAPNEKTSFRVSPLALITSKQVGRFNFFAEVDYLHIPQHAEIVQRPGGAGEGAHAGEKADVSGEGSIAVRNAWVEYGHARELNVRVGKFFSPQYWWQNRYPNVYYSTDIPIHLRELFPPELFGVMVSGLVARPAGDSELGVGYKFYVSNTESEQAFKGDVMDAKSWGGRLELHLPARGALRVLNVAGDYYNGATVLEGGSETVDNEVWGVEAQLELTRLLVNTEYARGRWLGNTRFGYYVQPALRLSDQWLAFYRIEGLESPRVQIAERRHLVGINFRPLPQVAVKAEYYRAAPLDRSFLTNPRAADAFNGLAAALALFF